MLQKLRDDFKDMDLAKTTRDTRNRKGHPSGHPSS